MRNIHTGPADSKKRKRGPSNNVQEDDGPQLDASSLRVLIRRGAQTLARPEVDISQMLEWDWATTLEKCKDQPLDTKATGDTEDDEAVEENWLNTMEKVETAVFDGKRHLKEKQKEATDTTELDRADRRVGKNTTVMVDGFAINKESMNCGDWEAVPTFAGRDSRLAEPKRAKKADVDNQEHCQTCWEGGDIVCCCACPRSYHIKCLDKQMQLKAKSTFVQFYCPQHECVDCQSKTAEAGGMMYRCRWCAEGWCEDCLDWNTVKLIGETLPEYEILGYPVNNNAWYIECPTCIKRWEFEEDDLRFIDAERKRIEDEYQDFLVATAQDEGTTGTTATPATVSEVGTPAAIDDFSAGRPAKKIKLF